MLRSLSRACHSTTPEQEPLASPDEYFVPASAFAHSEALFSAAEAGDVFMIEQLHQEGVKLNQSNGRCTALHVAAAHGQAEAVERLIQLGANPLSKDLYDHTPWYAAHKHHHDDAARILKDAAKKH